MFEECKGYNSNAESTGFTIHPEKSVLKPTQSLIYLGFIINSKDVTFRLTEEKKNKKCLTFVPNFFKKSKATIRFVAQVLGNIISSLSALPLGPLFHRTLETENIVGLKRHRQNYDAETELSNEACSELAWWK